MSLDLLSTAQWTKELYFLCQVLFEVLTVLSPVLSSTPPHFLQEMGPCFLGILFCTQLSPLYPPPPGLMPMAVLGPEQVITFGCAELASVDTTVVLMNRGEQQLAFAAIEMHLAFEQCRLQ